MSDDTQEELERSEIELLLPWYVTGRLDAADKARVESFLAAHPDMKRQLALVREEQEQSAHSNEALGAPSRASLESMMASIARATSGCRCRCVPAGTGFPNSSRRRRLKGFAGRLRLQPLSC